MPHRNIHTCNVHSTGLTGGWESDVLRLGYTSLVRLASAITHTTHTMHTSKYNAGLTGGWESDVLRLGYNSLTTPSSVIDHHIPSGRRAVKKEQQVRVPDNPGGFSCERQNATNYTHAQYTHNIHNTQVLGGFSSGDYVSERHWAASPDGVRVPISLVYRRDLFKKDGSAPMHLYG